MGFWEVEIAIKIPGSWFQTSLLERSLDRQAEGIVPGSQLKWRSGEPGVTADVAFSVGVTSCQTREMLNGRPYAATSTTTPIAQRPKLNGHRSSTDGAPRTKILLLGLRRSVNQYIPAPRGCYGSLLRAGKTSIQQVLFNNLSPKQTFYLETTMRIVKHTFECVRLRPWIISGLQAANAHQHYHSPGNLGLSGQCYCRDTRGPAITVCNDDIRDRHSRESRHCRLSVQLTKFNKGPI